MTEDTNTGGHAAAMTPAQSKTTQELAAAGTISPKDWTYTRDENGVLSYTQEGTGAKVSIAADGSVIPNAPKPGQPERNSIDPAAATRVADAAASGRVVTQEDVAGMSMKTYQAARKLGWQPGERLPAGVSA